MISIKVDSVAVMGMLGGLNRQLPFALSLGCNDIATGMQKHIITEMPNYIDRPTRYTLNALKTTRGNKQKPSASVWFKDPPKRSSHYLEPIVDGGSRHKKGSELALGNRWLAPGKAAASLGLIDGFGNFKRSALQQLLSYFGKAQASAGYTANSTAAGKAKMAKIKRTLNGKTVTKSQLMKDPTRGYKTIGGKVYFMSMGRGAGSRGQQHLAAGIWQKSGVHGVVVKPVLMEIKKPTYRKSFDFYGIGQKWADQNANKIMQAAVNYAIKTAR